MPPDVQKLATIIKVKTPTVAGPSSDTLSKTLPSLPSEARANTPASLFLGREWTVDEVVKWLHSIGVGSSAPRFKEANVNGRRLQVLSSNTILQLCNGRHAHAQLVTQALVSLRNANLPDSEKEPPPPVPSRRRPETAANCSALEGSADRQTALPFAVSIMV